MPWQQDFTGCVSFPLIVRSIPTEDILNGPSYSLLVVVEYLIQQTCAKYRDYQVLLTGIQAFCGGDLVTSPFPYWLQDPCGFHWAYLGEVCCISYSIHHVLALRMHSGHMGPHPLPGDTLDGETGSVNVKHDPSILLLFLPRGSGAAVRRGGGGLLGRAPAAEEAVGAGALGPAMPAQLSRGGASPAWRVRASHQSQQGQEEEEEELGQVVLLQLQWFLLICQCWMAHGDPQG